MRGRETIRDYFNAIGNVDVALDTFPYNGATTTLDALWMGVPVVGLSGDRGISRSSYSILRTLGAADLIAKRKSYVGINMRLAGDREWRNVLAEDASASPCGLAADGRRGFTRDLESRFREMWRRGAIAIGVSA